MDISTDSYGPSYKIIQPLSLFVVGVMFPRLSWAHGSRGVGDIPVRVPGDGAIPGSQAAATDSFTYT